MTHVGKSVDDLIVANGFCIGCGVCVGVCPKKNLDVAINSYGEYIAVKKGAVCPEKCSLCLTVCPFWNQEHDENSLSEKLFSGIDGIQYSEYAGYYLQNYVGYSNVDGHRDNGASGGLATYYLEKLLSHDIVDFVVSVKANQCKDKLFEYAIFNSLEDIRKSSRSCYYPVELSTIVRKIISENGRFAIIGLPCFIKGLRLAALKLPSLKNRIVSMAGLVCGQLQSQLFVNHLCKIKGIDPNDLFQVTFRVKDPCRPAHDFGTLLKYKSSNVEQSEVIYWSEGMGEIWTRGYYRPNACNYCDDIFAETADVVFMDAWLPEWSNDHKGNNFVITRSITASGIISNGLSNNEITLAPVDYNKIINSQIGVIKRKRGRTSYFAPKSQYFPTKRKFKIKLKISIIEKVMIAVDDLVRDIGRSSVKGSDIAMISNNWRLTILLRIRVLIWKLFTMLSRVKNIKRNHK
jgi:coenzyme F420 hydrogenase subunit beta